MNLMPESTYIRICRRYAAVAAWLAIVVSLLVMAGWWKHTPWLTGGVPGLATLKPATAFCFLLIGLSLLLMRERTRNIQNPGGGKLAVARVCAGLVVALGSAFIGERLFGWDLGIDLLLFPRTLAAAGSARPELMAGATALGFTLIGSALLLAEWETRKSHRPAQIMALMTVLVGVVALIGYFYGVEMLGVTGYSGLSLPTAVLFIALGLAVIGLHPDRGVMTVLTSDLLGSQMAGRSLPILVLLPILVGWLRLYGQRAGLYPSAFGTALTTSAYLVILTSLAWVSAKWLNRADLARRHAEARDADLARIVASSSEAIIGMSLEGAITSWNKGAERTFGYSSDEVAGKNATLLTPTVRLGEIPYFLAEVKKGASVERFETMRQCKDNSLIHISLTVSPVHDREGRVIGASSMERDITQRKQAEERFRLVVEASPGALILVDSRGLITLVNGQTEAIFGYPRKEMIGQPVEMLMPKRFVAAHEGLRAGFMAAPHGMAVGRELLGLRKDGTEVPVEISLNPVATPDGIIVLTSVVDITERKVIENTMARQRAALERSNRDLEQFAYVASHDLQEPLRAVAGCVQLLQKYYAHQLDQRAGEFIGHTVEGCTRMQTLIDDLLTFSRIGRTEDEYRSANCARALDAALENLSVSIQESGAQISRDPLPEVIGDASQLTMLFQNLVGNAIKFRKPGEAPRIHIGGVREGVSGSFSVTDNGIGIAPEYFERIFGVFQRLHTRREYPGTGIGLAVCKRIVESHGGHIRIESVPGQSTTFLFDLPLSKNEEQGTPAAGVAVEPILNPS